MGAGRGSMLLGRTHGASPDGLVPCPPDPMLLVRRSQLTLELRKVLLDEPPNRGEVDTEMTVDDHVPKPGDPTPGDGRMLLPEVARQPLR
jgi:hypothetical protein